MKGDTMFKVRFGIFIAVFVLFVAGISVAQQDTTDIYTQPREGEFDRGTYENDVHTTTKPWTDDLRSRLNLRDDQVSEINDIMLRYHRESTEIQGSPEVMGTDRMELQNRYSTEIESILDDNQRTQWETYHNTWWDNVNNTRFEQEGTEGQYDTRDEYERQRESDIERDRNIDSEVDTEVDRDNTETEPEEVR
jgi:hypothetical protein